MQLDPSSVQRKLQYNAQHDPAPGVREKNAAILGMFGGPPPAEDPRMVALRSNDPVVALGYE